MDKAIKGWLTAEGTNTNTQQLKLPYTIYGCMLLLSHNAFQSEAWKTTLTTSNTGALQRLYLLLVHHLKITHIAITHPIPLNNSNDTKNENIIRSPSNFESLYGDFGPSTASSPPSREDFEAAFWVTAKQNGIYQTWAPRWTMFSRGNISEKARILELESVAQAVREGDEDGKGCAAVDLYAGIGYFVFSYLGAGVETVLCWDLNAWSCEGLRRGAKANGWEVVDGREEGVETTAHGAPSVVVLNESNKKARSRVSQMRQALPPVRHVNCGLLPTSKGSWQTAVDVLDPHIGGWVHVHENFAVQDIETKTEEVRQAFQQILRDGREVELEFVNHLKSYAPGVMHCVLDLFIPPRTHE